MQDSKEGFHRALSRGKSSDAVEEASELSPLRKLDSSCRKIRRVTFLNSFTPLLTYLAYVFPFSVIISIGKVSTFTFAGYFQGVLFVVLGLHLAIRTLSYGILRTRYLEAHYGKWKSGLFYTRSSLIEFFNPRWLCLVFVIPLTVDLILAPHLGVQSLAGGLWDKMPRINPHIPSSPYLFVLLATVGHFGSHIVWYIQLRMGSFLYRRRVVPRLEKRKPLMKRLAKSLACDYSQRSMEFYPVEWKPLEGGRTPVAQLKSDAWDIITEKRGHPCYDLWHSSSYGFPYNIVGGEWKGHTFSIFDYHDATDIRFPIRKGNPILLEKDTSDFSVVALEFDKPMPSLIVYPEAILDKFAKYLGRIDIDFESFEFSEKYRVWCKDRRFAYDACTVLIMEFLEDHPRLALKIQGKVMTVRFPEWASPEELRECLDQLIAKHSRIIEDFSRREASYAHKA